MRKILLYIAVAALCVVSFTGCTESDADVASRNLSKAAEQFEIPRRIVFINAITDKYLLEIQGFCSIETAGGLKGAVEVTCKDGNTFKKHFLVRSDNVTVVSEQVEGANVSTKHYRVIFKPETIVPNFDRP